MGAVLGIDGCRGGWVVASRASGAIEVRVVEAIAEVLLAESFDAAGIDIPIGLPEHYTPGGRACDRAARARLGARRGSSVFPCPARGVLAAESYAAALKLNRTREGEAIGISRQCFHILPKVREVDAVMTPALEGRVVEVHPELSFYELNGGAPIGPSKKTREGRTERILLLERAWDQPLTELVEEAARGPACMRDDVVDALVVCWSAERYLAGEALTEPEDPATDGRGLHMRIVR